MGNDSPILVIWRRKAIIIATFLIFAGTTAIVSKSLEPVYATESKLLIALRADTPTFDSVQAAQSVARSYTEVIKSPNVARAVAQRLGPGASDRRVVAASSFEPLRETQLLQIRAEDPDPLQAKRLADTYA